MKKVGFSSGLKRTNRKIKKFEEGNYKEQFMASSQNME